MILTPKNLLGVDEFNQAFFDKIDDIENQISKGIDFKTIVTIGTLDGPLQSHLT